MCCGNDQRDIGTRYDKDPRVERQNGGGFIVTAPDEKYYVLHTDAFGWTICVGRNLDFVQVSGDGSAIGIDHPTHAIAALIGDPATQPPA